MAQRRYTLRSHGLAGAYCDAWSAWGQLGPAAEPERPPSGRPPAGKGSAVRARYSAFGSAVMARPDSDSKGESR